MRLLFDHNLSPRLIDLLADLFPESSHVYLLGLERADDEEVWIYARENGYTIVSKDADFGELAVLRRKPPGIIWIRLGNCKTEQVERLLRSHSEQIRAFEGDLDASILTLIPANV